MEVLFLHLMKGPILVKFQLGLPFMITKRPVKFHRYWSRTFLVILITDKKTDAHE